MAKSIFRKNWWLLLLFLFDFAYFYFIKHISTPKTNGAWVSINWDGFFFVFVISLFSLAGVRWVKSRLDKLETLSIPLKYLQILIYSFVLFIIVTASVQLSVEYLAGNQRNLEYVISNGLTFTFLHIIISNAYVAVEYFRESNALKQDLLRSEKAKAESELKVLQQQMNPHFLFNNLNTLASLIPNDTEKAVQFTHGLSHLFRYVSQNGKKDIISLREELEFLDHYMNLMHFRFGEAYQLVKNLNTNETDHWLLVPLALQVVIENVVKHNSGNRRNPLLVEITLTNDHLVVRNPIRKKSNPELGESGIGLKNLQERYQLISGRCIQYGAVNGHFQVQLPLIKSIDDEGFTD